MGIQRWGAALVSLLSRKSRESPGVITTGKAPTMAALPGRGLTPGWQILCELVLLGSSPAQGPGELW